MSHQKLRILGVAVLTIAVLLMTGTVTQAKIIAAWLFDESTGKVVKDHSGNGYDGEITGGKWIDGKFGKALEFDIGTFVEVKDPKGVFNLSKSLTVMTWGYLTDMPENYTGIPRKMDSKDAGGWVLHPSKEGAGYKLYFWAYISGNWKGVGSQTVLQFSKDWHHFAITYDGKTLKAYVDGKLEGTLEAPGEIVPGDGNLRFSKECCGANPTRTFNSDIDEYILSDEVLSETEIKEIMQTGLRGLITPVDNRDKLATVWGHIKSAQAD